MQDISSKTNARRYYHSSSFVMALLFTLLLGTGALIIAYSGYYFGNEYFVRSAEKTIDTEMYYLLTAEKGGALAAVLSEAETRPGRIYGVFDKDGNVIEGSPKIFSTSIPLFDANMIIFEKNSVTYGAKIYELGGQRKILIGVDITEMLAVTKTVRLLGIITIVLMGVVILTSFVISTFVVSRTNRIALTAKEIMDTGDLSRRIEIDGRWDDLSNMASVLNAFLERIEALLVGIKRVSDNIAHDLRTPLTRLRNNLEDLRDKSGEADPKREAYDALISESDRLLETFNALLRIARIETSKQKTQFRNFNLSKLLQDVVELYEPLAEEKNLILKTEMTPHLMYHGDSDLMFQAVANLLDNAIKFTPARGRIEIELREDHKIIMRDTGPGIAHEDIGKVFDRFYRAETSRTTTGNGLGLSLVAAVIMLHNGKIDLKNLDSGLEITLAL